jgi:hypothetical protein
MYIWKINRRPTKASSFRKAVKNIRSHVEDRSLGKGGRLIAWRSTDVRADESS